MPDYDQLTQFAQELAHAAGEAILPSFRQPLAVTDKEGMSDFDPVTEADRAGEAVMRQMINQRFPDHGIHGEEYGLERADAEFVWTLDPIDGTRAFIAGLPCWTTLVALMHQGEPVIGVIAQPYMGEQFVGGPSGSYFKDQRLNVRSCGGLAHAIGSTTGTSWFSGEQKRRIQGFLDGAKLVRFGFDAYAYAILSMGFIDTIAEAGLKTYDWAALIPVVRGAGGLFTDWSGGHDFAAGEVLASGDARVHDQMIAVLAG